MAGRATKQVNYIKNPKYSGKKELLLYSYTWVDNPVQ